MAQSTFNDGDTYGVARTTINGNATDAETRLDALEGGSTFNLIEVTPAQSPYTIASWDSIIAVKNDTAPIDLILPAASNDDLGKEIEFWIEHNPANYKVRMLAPSGSMEINNVGNDGSDWAKAEFNSNFPNYIRVKARCVGVNEVYINLVSSVYNALRYVVNFSSTSDYSPFSHLKLDAVPTNFLTDNDSWWFAAKIEKPMVNDSSTQVLFGSNNFFVGYRGNGTYFSTSGTSGYFQTVSPTTIVESGEWIIYNWDATANRYSAWVNGTKVLNSTSSGATPPTTAPTDVWFGTEETDLVGPPSGYGYPLQDCKISNISIGSGNLSDADAALFTPTQFACPTLSAGVLTNQWVPQTGNVVTRITGAIDVALVGEDISTEEI